MDITLLDLDEMRQSTNDNNEDYKNFTEKFVPKSTTDDCFTPPPVYDAVLGWVCEEYKVGEGACIVRPFYPGGDYETFEYPAGCVVVDNPPFSILSGIVRFYVERGIKFFLFAPHLTLFSTTNVTGVSYLAASCAVEYDNGAKVNTSFITNLEPVECVRSCPVLYERVGRAVDEFRRERVRELPRYKYPDEVLTATRVGLLSRYGVEFVVPLDKLARVSRLDAQKPIGKSIFGSGFLMSPSLSAEAAEAAEAAKAAKAAEAAKAAKAAEAAEAAKAAKALKFELSPRERTVIARLDDVEAPACTDFWIPNTADAGLFSLL